MRIRAFSSALALVLSFVFVPAVVNAWPDAWTASVSGTVADVKSLAPVPGASIEIMTAQSTEVLARTHSDAQGRFAFSGLRGGQYRLHFRKAGYQGTIMGGIYVRPGERFIEAAPIAMYPVGVPIPRRVVEDPCGSMVDPAQTADVYIVCSGN